MRVAYQGEPGAYGEEAAMMECGPAATLLPLPTFMDVVHAVMSGVTERAVLPVENSIIGIVHDGAAAAATPGLNILHKVEVPVSHCLLARPGVTLDQIAQALSHQAALLQCTAFFDTHPHIVATPWYDTAGAAKHVAHAHQPGLAAIASRRAGLRYGLEVLMTDIQDREDNVTRFVVVSSR